MACATSAGLIDKWQRRRLDHLGKNIKDNVKINERSGGQERRGPTVMTEGRVHQRSMLYIGEVSEGMVGCARRGDY
ncbi:hypothetical protein Tco_0486450 [Tanacetum coccineum]